MKKQCKECKQEKDLKDFPSIGIYNKKTQLRTACKPCWSKISGNLAKEKLLAKKPDQYSQCSNEECLNIWAHKVVYSSRRQMTKALCPYCGSSPE